MIVITDDNSGRKFNEKNKTKVNLESSWKGILKYQFAKDI